MKRFLIAVTMFCVVTTTANAQIPTKKQPIAGSAMSQTVICRLSWSEYPSWSVMGVADEIGLLDGEKGKLGSIEKKYNVDIVLNLRDYDTCITEYGAGGSDAVCITNMDILPLSLGRKSVAILPTSTSYGADALIVSKDISSIDQLKGKKIYGLAKSVSQFTFDRCVEKRGGNPDDFQFTNMDPGAAAIAFQQKQSGISAIVVWNPFVIETLNKRKDAHVLFDSKDIKDEIVDMIVMSADFLKSPGGDRAATAIIDAFYEINVLLETDNRKDDILIALGEKFANLTLKHMREVVRQTSFYKTPQVANDLFSGEAHRKVMIQVSEYCQKRGMIDRQPSIGYGNASLMNDNLVFDTTYIERVNK